MATNKAWNAAHLNMRQRFDSVPFLMEILHRRRENNAAPELDTPTRRPESRNAIAHCRSQCCIKNGICRCDWS